MITEAELVAAMGRSGRQVSKRTLRNWRSRQILPAPCREWLGRKGSSSYWHDDHVLVQASIAHELLTHKATFRRTAAYLWILGFDIPAEKARAGIEELVARFRKRLAKQAPGASVEHGVWAIAKHVARQDARMRGGSQADGEGQALFSLTGGLLELLAGVGDGEPAGDNELWVEDTANKLYEHLGFLRSLRSSPEEWPQGPMTPMPAIETVEQMVKLISTFVALPRQQEALRHSTPTDLERVRRLTMLAANRLDEAVAATTASYPESRPLFARVAGGWMWLLFPSLLIAIKNPAYWQQIIEFLFSLSAKVRQQRGTWAVKSGG